MLVSQAAALPVIVLAPKFYVIYFVTYLRGKEKELTSMGSVLICLQHLGLRQDQRQQLEAQISHMDSRDPVP